MQAMSESESVLPSWNEGQARDSILGFVDRVTGDGPGFIPPADRIAAFDNDGTLWVEQPLPPQFDFVFGTWAEEVRQDPSLASRQPYQALIEKDPEFLHAVAIQDPDAIGALLQAFAHSWAGVTAADFDDQVRRWLATVKQEKFGVSYPELVYQPMLELFGLLREHEFRVFVCSGGGRDFMRVFAEQTWGIPKENVIGSAAEYVYADGTITRGEHLLGSLDLGPGKPEHIFAHTGRLPLLAGGNADVDIEMLSAAPFALLVSHDDARREYAYTAAAEASLARAGELGWTVVSMQDDWNTIFAEPGNGNHPARVS
jgi:phosphoserine phosphatase